jgi:uncharacterized Ntn-hydrolase superfamily protein
MTFSLVARCARTGQVGVGAITAMVGVGKLVSHAEASVGAVATQAMINPYLGFDGLRHMGSGRSAEEALATVIDADPGRDLRQCGMVDAEGGSAAWTGSETPGWSGHRTGSDYAAQGNRLVGPETIEAVVERFQATSDLDLAERLLLALEAGEATGADTKGALSGVVYVMDREEYPLWDVRVDHADDPAAELRRLWEEYREQLLPQVRKLSTRDDQLGAMTREEMEGGD